GVSEHPAALAPTAADEPERNGIGPAAHLGRDGPPEHEATNAPRRGFLKALQCLDHLAFLFCPQLPWLTGRLPFPAGRRPAISRALASSLNVVANLWKHSPGGGRRSPAPPFRARPARGCTRLPARRCWCRAGSGSPRAVPGPGGGNADGP